MSFPLLSSDQEALVDAVAHRVVELLNEREQRQRLRELVDAQTLAKLLGISRATVYEHASELGAIELGDGSKPRLRFDVDQARAAWTRRGPDDELERATPATPTRSPRRRRNAARSDDGLLPIGATAPTARA